MIRRSSDLTHVEIRQLIGGGQRLILEIGCNDGVDTNELLKHNPEATIFCWECDPRAIADFKRNVPIQHRVRLHEHALAAEHGFRQFHMSSGDPYGTGEVDWNKSGSLLKPTGHLRISPWCKFEKSIQIHVSTLDDCMADSGYADYPVDFWRLDVQGAELEVIRGGEKTLAQTRIVQMEVHPYVMYEGAPTEREAIAFMAERGFECEGRYAADLLMVRKS